MINIELLKLALLIGVFFVIWLAFRIPVQYREGYVEWIREQHHPLVLYSLGALFTLVGVGVLAINAFPGQYPILEIANLIAALVIIAFLAWDNLNF